MNESKLRAIYQRELDMPRHKVAYMLDNDLLFGCAFSAMRYGFEITPEVFEVFLEELNSKLVHGEDVEYDEWTESQWENLMKIKARFALG